MTSPGASLAIERWNQHGVCEEIVIGFDTDAYWAERRAVELQGGAA